MLQSYNAAILQCCILCISNSDLALCRLLHGACPTSRVVCYTLCCMLQHAARCMFHVACCTLHVACCTIVGCTRFHVVHTVCQERRRPTHCSLCRAYTCRAPHPLCEARLRFRATPPPSRVLVALFAVRAERTAFDLFMALDVGLSLNTFAQVCALAWRQ